MFGPGAYVPDPTEGMVDVPAQRDDGCWIPPTSPSRRPLASQRPLSVLSLTTLSD